MNTNVSESGSLFGKMMAILIASLFALSSFSAMVSASDDEEESETTMGITLGEAIVTGEGDINVVSEFNPAPLDGQELPVPVTTMVDGKYSPARQDPGDAKVFLMDDDAENWMSGPWIEASHVETALNDGGYSFDVYRGGKWGGPDLQIPGGDAGLSMLDDYEVVIWYSGWNTAIFSSAETDVLGQYLDGDCGEGDDFCVPSTSRNMILLTQMTDWVDAYSGQFENTYFHSDTQSSSYLIVGGTSNPMKGVSGSIFEGKEFATDSAGVHYLDRPCGIKTTGPESVGAFWYDARKGAADGHEYHAVQFPSETYAGTQQHKAFHFADEIGVFNKRSDRADFFASILSWMEVTKETTKNVDIGIGGVDIPNHVQYWRSVESMEPVDIIITATNYGMLPQSSTAVHLKLKNQFGQILFDSTFDTRAFPEGHPMHIEDSIQNGDSVVFTFNRSNDKYQRLYDGLDGNNARHVLFTSAGMDVLTAEVVHTGDQGTPNNYVQAQVGVGKWIETMEHPDDEIGTPGTIADTTDNGANSFDGVNMHRTSSYDWDADGCGYFDNDEETCTTAGRTVNKTVGSVYHEGKSSLAMFNTSGWYKTNANPDNCDWGANSRTDGDCPKFAMQPNQDDYFMSPAIDLSAMDEVVIGMLFTGCMESGDYFRMQISLDGIEWTNLINYSGFCPGEGAWYLWGGGNLKYQGYVLSDTYYGKEGTDTVFFRIQADADSDQNTEGNRPFPGWFIDEIVFRGTEKITRDVAVGDVTVDQDFAVGDQDSDLWREINATVINAGESSWPNLPVKFTVKNLQGEDMSGYLDVEEAIIDKLEGESLYGDITKNTDQKELFSVFQCPGANTYFAKIEVLVPAGKDFFPWNNSKTVSFRVFDNFFSDNFDSGDRDDYTYTKVERLDSGSDRNLWIVDSVGNYASQGQYVLQYSEEGTHNDDVPDTVGGRDDSVITQDEYDRDGSGEKWILDVNVDLRAAYKPIVMFGIKWDLGSGDRLEVRASTNFDSVHKLGGDDTWTVIKTYEENCDCTFWSEDKNTWVMEELSLEAFEGYQTWIDFRVVTVNGGGRGVLIDEFAVIGNEYRNNIMIEDVDLGSQVLENENELSVTIRGAGLESQEGVTVSAKIIDSNGMRVWPTDRSYNFFELTSALGKGEEFTVDSSVAGADWIYGSNLVEGTYHIDIMVWRDDDSQVPDEKPMNNIWFESFELVYGDADNDGITDNMDNCSDTPDGEEVDDYGCSSYQNGGPYLNAFPTGSGGDIEDYEMRRNNTDVDASITIEATELVGGNSYMMDWYIFTPIVWYGDVWEMAADAQNIAEGSWSFDAPSTSVEYFIEPEVFNDLGSGCYMFVGRLTEWHDDSEYVLIEAEDWPFTLDLSFDECVDPGEGECPFSGEDYCYEYAPYCAPESSDYDPVYCGEGTAHYCLEDGSDDEGCSWLVDACAAGQESEELCTAFENFNHELYHAYDFPIISLLGENVLTLTQSSDMNYLDAGASCFDAQDGDITNNIEVHGAVVNYNNEGSYTIFYDCTDSDGNHATTQSRTVIVQADPNTDDNGNVTEKEIKAEEVASISLIPVLISIGLLTIVRRRFNR